MKTPSITKITVVTGTGTDAVFVETTLPSAVWPFEDQTMTMRFEACRGTGVKYVREYFDTEPVVIVC